tara:strand:- start:250 stop:366 length:117 start_codon:yes stop_codon:yes gene_type:complete
VTPAKDEIAFVKGDHHFSEMVLPPIDKKFIKEKVVIDQ